MTVNATLCCMSARICRHLLHYNMLTRLPYQLKLYMNLTKAADPHCWLPLWWIKDNSTVVLQENQNLNINMTIEGFDVSLSCILDSYDNDWVLLLLKEMRNSLCWWELKSASHRLYFFVHFSCKLEETYTKQNDLKIRRTQWVWCKLYLQSAIQEWVFVDVEESLKVV